MPLYMFTGRSKGKNKKRDRTGVRSIRSKPTRHVVPQPFYLVDPPQEFDEPGKELGPDAQVWKTYVKEADQVDGELVDGWDKYASSAVMSHTLFMNKNWGIQVDRCDSEFVIESYKTLKRDPVELSAQALLSISQTLASIANGSQTFLNQPLLNPETQVEAPAFLVSRSAICVNVLWFLSLSLSVAVSLISMLAKEWCLKFMSGRTGPPGVQARRRQQRWDRLVSWRMEEVLMILPSLIHLSLLLFAIGLSVFLWDIHFGVAIPVVLVTTIAFAAYVICTILPFVDDYCPYGTVLSILYHRFTLSYKQATQKFEDWTLDSITAKALHWMTKTCETPRSVDIALQSFAGITKTMPYEMLVEWDLWAVMKRRLGARDPFCLDAYGDPSGTVHAKALHSVVIFRDENDGLDYGSKAESRKLEALALGLQSSIDSRCHRIIDLEMACDTNIKGLLRKCATIGIQLLKSKQATPMRPGSKEKQEVRLFWARVVNPEKLLDEITNRLEQYLNGTIELGPTTYPVLYAAAAFVGCCCPAQVTKRSFVKLLRVFIIRTGQLQKMYDDAPSGSRSQHQAERLWDEYILRDREVSFLLGLLPILYANSRDHIAEESSRTVHHCLEASIEYIWEFLIAGNYSEPDTFDHATHRATGVMHLLTHHSHYELSPKDCNIIANFASRSHVPCFGWLDLMTSKVQFIKLLNSCLAVDADVTWVDLPPQIMQILQHLIYFWPGNEPLVPAPAVYLLTVKHLCQAKTIKQKQDYYELMTRFPFPKISPGFMDMLFDSDIVTEITNAALRNNDLAIKSFATAQLWLFFNMSIEFPDRTSQTLTILEKTLLNYPIPDGDVSNQEMVADQLEAQLISLLEEHYDRFGEELGNFDYRERRAVNRTAYLYRVLECISEKRGDLWPVHAEQVLHPLPDSLRRLGSSIYLEGEAPTQNATVYD